VQLSQSWQATHNLRLKPMPLQATSGAASYDGFGGGVAAVPNYIEDVFSTYLYTGTGASLTITNNIDLSTKGGLVWTKDRTSAGSYHWFDDTVRGAGKTIWSNVTNAQTSYTSPNGNVTSFLSNGFINGDSTAGVGNSQVSWTFRKQPKFFDVVTYTGTGSARTISHSLGSAPGCVIIKKTSSTGNWATWHRSGTQINTYVAFLNSIGTYQDQGNDYWGSLTMSSTVFSVGTTTDVNASGETYVAYLFAHDAGGFGLTGTDNVISCGSYTGTGAAGNFVTLGYEPQWLLIKRINTTGNWLVLDNMRGIATGDVDAGLFPNLSNAEDSTNDYLSVNATGFELTGVSTTVNASGSTYIYIAIRRGPMKVPTSGTSVFAPVAFTGTNTTTVINAGFPMDMVWIQARNTNAVLGGGAYDLDRLRGNVNRLFIPSTGAESASLGSPYDTFDNMTGLGADGTYFNNSAINYSNWFFRRASSFFDEVCYTGTGANTTFAHNLGVAPELMIVKQRGAAGTGWIVYHKDVGATKYLNLNTTAASATLTTVWNSTAPTSSVFSVGTNTSGNASGGTYVNYLFATCAGVSKVGSYTGNGSSQTINCGFTGGARFVLIKRTDSTGDWYVWDTARGIVTANDPHLSLNTTAAEVTTDDTIDTDSTGFVVNQVTATNVNVSAATYIYLAIA
jgi:hypothetical protein